MSIIGVANTFSQSVAQLFTVITAAAVLARVCGLFESFMKQLQVGPQRKGPFLFSLSILCPPVLSNFWMQIAPGLNQKKDEQNPCKLVSAQMALVTNSPSNSKCGARSPGFSLMRPFLLLRRIGVSYQAREGHVSSSRFLKHISTLTLRLFPFPRCKRTGYPCSI